MKANEIRSRALGRSTLRIMRTYRAGMFLPGIKNQLKLCIF